jgi:hypothetical protein
MRGSFTCRKVGTWDRLFNFPSEGRHAEDFYVKKNPTSSAGFEPANSGTRGQHANHQTNEAVKVSIKLSSSTEAKKFVLFKIIRISWNQNIRYHDHEIPLHVPISTQNPVHALTA